MKTRGKGSYPSGEEGGEEKGHRSRNLRESQIPYYPKKNLPAFPLTWKSPGRGERPGLRPAASRAGRGWRGDTFGRGGKKSSGTLSSLVKTEGCGG